MAARRLGLAYLCSRSWNWWRASSQRSTLSSSDVHAAEGLFGELAPPQVLGRSKFAGVVEEGMTNWGRSGGEQRVAGGVVLKLRMPDTSDGSCGPCRR